MSGASPAAELVERMLAGDLNALAKLLTRVESVSPEMVELLARIRPHADRARTVGITGPPGAGKSTLVDRLAHRLREEGHRVGILAADPSSPYTGGALLGDRIRMQSHAADPGVFIRSVGSRGNHGGLTQTARAMVDVMAAAGFEEVLIETVGVGQTELDVARLATTTVAVLVPESGDSIQAFKSGLMEAADLFVINKADRAGARRLRAEIETSVQLSPRADGFRRPVLLTIAATGEGVAELVDAIRAHQRWRAEHPAPHGALHRREEFLDILADHLRRRAEAALASDACSSLRARVETGDENLYALALEALGSGLVNDGR